MTALTRVVATLLMVPLVSGLAPVPRASALDGPSEVLHAVAIPGTGRLVVVDAGATVGDQATWTFDTRTHRWSRQAGGPPAVAASSLLAHLPGSGEVLSIPRWPGAVWTMDLGDGSWSAGPVPIARPDGVSDIAVDTRRGDVLAWFDGDDSLWTYSAAAHRWAAVPRTAPWPTAAMPEGQRGYRLMAYDSHADRIVFAVLPVPGRPGITCLFDPSTARWTRQDSRPPALMLGYGEWGTEAVYDAAHRRTVLLGRGALATYDSNRDRWQLADDGMWPGMSYGPRDGPIIDGGRLWPRGIPLGPLARDGHQLVVDDVQDRIVLLGGTALFRMVGADDVWDLEWHPVREVWAYDVGFNSWTRLTGGQG